MTPGARLAIGTLVVLLGLFFSTMGVRMWLDGRAPAARGVVVDARLTETGFRPSDSDTGLRVHYRFEVDGRAYVRTGVFGTPVGSDVSAATLEEAQRSGVIAIRYRPDDPEVNEPVASPRSIGDKAPMAFGIGIVMLLTGLIRIGGALTARADARQPFSQGG